ncbi:PP2C family protein-serine/threonine phosphatase [Nakamurella deserti]|uniref:PP2C family protein-serine/threonine phosphatase n=1 Tax=Nakamurella deserti TaxID=2164074 RepID=UPI000DBE77F1|nr:SpoIIE family protein phosphatase [Nakamurella deserti]
MTAAPPGARAGRTRRTPVDAALDLLLGATAAPSDPLLHAAAEIRRTVRTLTDAAEGMTEALVTSQDRLLALRALTRVNVDTLGADGSTERVLDEALALTDSDAVVLLSEDGSVHVSGDDLAATELVLQLAAAAESDHAPGLWPTDNGRTVIVRLAENAGRRIVLGFLRRDGAPFNTGDLGLIEAVASATEMMHTLTRLHLQGVRRATIEREHQFASSLAQAVLEAPIPLMDGIDVFASSTPASLAGGDFMTFMDVDGILWFAVGDVAGKGLPAAMVMTRAVSAARVAFLTHRPDDAVGALLAMGRELYDYLDEVGLFVTTVLGAFHPDTGELHLCNAGHSPVLTVSGAGVMAVPASVPPLGIMADPPARGTVITLAPGDALLLGSDGLAEQENGDGDLFGYERFQNLCVAAAGIDSGAGTTSADDLGRMLIAAVSAFADGTPPSDDCTLAVIRREGQA